MRVHDMQILINHCRTLVFILSEMRSLWKGLGKRLMCSELQFSQDFSGCRVENGLKGLGCARQGQNRGREVAAGIIQGRYDGGWTRVATGEVVGRGWILTHFESSATRFAAGLDTGYARKSKAKEF